MEDPGSAVAATNHTNDCTECPVLGGKQRSIQSFFGPVKRIRISDSTPAKMPTPTSGLEFNQEQSQVDGSQPAHSEIATNCNENRRAAKDPSKSTQKLKLRQVYLDLGQRAFGKQTICKTCGMMFVHGVQEDVDQHDKICDEFLHGVHFQLKNPRLVGVFDEGSIVEVRPTDSHQLRQKVKQVKSLVDCDLGFLPSKGSIDDKTAYLFVRNKRVIAMATAEIISKAFVLKGLHERSSESRKAMIGIHQLWVHPRCRKTGVATHLVDVISSKLVYGLSVSPTMIAFSSPTEAGAQFAESYIKSKSGESNPAVLVYDCV